MQDKSSVFRSKAPGICWNGPAPNPIPAQVIRRSDIEVDGTARVVYRGDEGHIHELWLPPNGEWHLGDLTELTGAPPAAGDPASY